ncbi:uncharacterized protein BX664DRAFT_341718 [Halteromyces radiatus]|uniref:uncharacterized protein n=1 Tax=Halteromyces radiatus TaxID=101107 RepID=UPI0022201368|nr:uncharacterized protein BX664DRAFT_341718 [Halteromyces radiatus]KAI8079889.1 hypothetical protein BX664DRAFT_341718 [Halteromyces radiatus]
MQKLNQVQSEKVFGPTKKKGPGQNEKQILSFCPFFRMKKVTKEQAICMLFCKEYNDENVVNLGKRLKEMELEVCYIHDPTEPVLIPIRSISVNPLKYHLYVPLSMNKGSKTNNDNS